MVGKDREAPKPFLYKGELLRWVFDETFAAPEGRDACYEDAIALLSGDGPLESLTQEWAFGTLDEANQNHFREHWIEPAQGGLDPYMRAVLTEIIQHAKDRHADEGDVALEAIMFYSTDSTFEIGYVDNLKSVLVVIKVGVFASKIVADQWSKVIPPESGEVILEAPA